MHLLESRLLDTFFKNVICSTKKRHLLDRKKYAVRVPRVNFEQLVKKLHLLEFSIYIYLYQFIFLIYFCHLLEQCRAVEILVSSSFFEQMNFEQMTLLRQTPFSTLISC